MDQKISDFRDFQILRQIWEGFQDFWVRKISRIFWKSENFEKIANFEMRYFCHVGSEFDEIWFFGQVWTSINDFCGFWNFSKVSRPPTTTTKSAILRNRHSHPHLWKVPKSDFFMKISWDTMRLRDRFGVSTQRPKLRFWTHLIEIHHVSDWWNQPVDHCET